MAEPKYAPFLLSISSHMITRGRCVTALTDEPVPEGQNYIRETNKDFASFRLRVRPPTRPLLSAKLLEKGWLGAAGRAKRYPQVSTKFGLMVGLGEVDDEILKVMRDLRAHDVDMLTIGQYLAPSSHHLPVRRYVHPDVFKQFEQKAGEMGFSGAACGALVRSSYWADQQAHSAGVAIS